MKLLNRVELIVDKKRYTDQGLKKGDKGIVLGEERNGYWLVYFDGEIFQGADGVWQTTEIDAAVLEEDVKVILEQLKLGQLCSDIDVVLVMDYSV